MAFLGGVVFQYKFVTCWVCGYVFFDLGTNIIYTVTLGTLLENMWMIKTGIKIGICMTMN